MSCAIYNYTYKSRQPEIAWDDFWKALPIEKQLRDLEKLDTTHILSDHLPKQGKIIDAGCGLGKWVVYLRRRGYDIVGVETSRKAIEAAKRFDPSVPIEYANVCRLGYRDDAFDVYLSFGVINYFIEGPQGALREAKRVLRSGGLLFVKVPLLSAARVINDSLLYRPLVFLKTNNFLRKIFRKPLCQKKHFMGYRYTKKECIHFVEKEGFEIMHLIPHQHLQGLSHSYVEPDVFTGRLRILKRFNQALALLLKRISPWLACSILIIARNKK